MLERIVTAIVLALVNWLETKYANSTKPIEADNCPDSLARIGERVRVWQDSIDNREQPPANG